LRKNLNPGAFATGADSGIRKGRPDLAATARAAPINATRADGNAGPDTDNFGKIRRGRRKALA
jgi:hypothetical protein